MGADVTSYAFIGVKLEHKDLFKEQLVKIGAHDFPEDVKFHPQTGKALWEMRDVPIHSDFIDEYGELVEKWEGLHIKIASDMDGYEKFGYYIYKDYLRAGDDSEVLYQPLLNIKELEDEILGKLSKHALATKAKFGLHLLHLWG